MPVIPETRLDQIEFCESHLPVWTAAPNPVAIGITAAQTTALATGGTGAEDGGVRVCGK